MSTNEKLHSEPRDLASVRRGDVVVLPPGLGVWWNKTAEEIDAEYQRNAREGRFLDSAGEPILISSMGHTFLQSPAFALVTKLKGADWTHWSHRPRRLTEVLVTLEDGTTKYMMFSRPLPKREETHEGQ